VCPPGEGWSGLSSPADQGVEEAAGPIHAGALRSMGVVPGADAQPPRPGPAVRRKAVPRGSVLVAAGGPPVSSPGRRLGHCAGATARQPYLSSVLSRASETRPVLGAPAVAKERASSTRPQGHDGPRLESRMPARLIVVPSSGENPRGAVDARHVQFGPGP
jgi:hypothetical protein